MKGCGDGHLIGREVQFHLLFDPTKGFHNYAILWNPNEIIFFVDVVPIRRYPKKGDATFPQRPMYVYGSVWDASSWATVDGRIKANYRYYKNCGCITNDNPSCHLPFGSLPRVGELSRQQSNAMESVQRNYKVYDYCRDPQRDRTHTPEC
ncbi:hypothetical protein H5410_030501 [Solanum commersonii]|uniref:xyloglucan:xyloglucosyl transferase n=1 Tax=Solanum commersonii TaxID=4109 RepID=A0A9J5YEG6_SOLCO|nr:hypothetical protein H5410_030501 [Solanum commersonii]